MRQARITGVRETSRILAQTSFGEPQRGMGSRPTCRACLGVLGNDTLVRSTVSNWRRDQIVNQPWVRTHWREHWIASKLIRILEPGVP